MIRKYTRYRRQDVMGRDKPEEIVYTLEMPDRMFELVRFQSQRALHPAQAKHYSKFYDHYVRWTRK
jgi:hypothetical protein